MKVFCNFKEKAVDVEDGINICGICRTPADHEYLLCLDCKDHSKFQSVSIWDDDWDEEE